MMTAYYQLVLHWNIYPESFADLYISNENAFGWFRIKLLLLLFRTVIHYSRSKHPWKLRARLLPATRLFFWPWTSWRSVHQISSCGNSIRSELFRKSNLVIFTRVLFILQQSRSAPVCMDRWFGRHVRYSRSLRIWPTLYQYPLPKSSVFVPFVVE